MVVGNSLMHPGIVSMQLGEVTITGIQNQPLLDHGTKNISKRFVEVDQNKE